MTATCRNITASPSGLPDRPTPGPRQCFAPPIPTWWWKAAFAPRPVCSPSTRSTPVPDCWWTICPTICAAALPISAPAGAMWQLKSRPARPAYPASISSRLTSPRWRQRSAISATRQPSHISSGPTCSASRSNAVMTRSS
ncbi:hypothetical protein AJ88_42950 [Mesorhizobium amorphae CCBAU 01583]|nr:hypothetical protein AJ88_42950 [Mesorhizobium amorphae CCBAU 01583]